MCFISVLGKQFQQERHHGVVVRKLACSVEGRLKSPLIEWETLSFHPAAYVYQTLFRAWVGFGGEGRGDGHHPSHALPIETSGTLTFTVPTANRLLGLT